MEVYSTSNILPIFTITNLDFYRNHTILPILAKGIHNLRNTACGIAQAKSTARIAGEISTFIKDSLAHSTHGDPTKPGTKLERPLR